MGTRRFEAQLVEIAGTFATSLARVLKDASVFEIVSLGGATDGSGAREPALVASRGGFTPRTSLHAPLVRRSDEEIAKLAKGLGRLLTAHRTGLRAEALRLASGLSKRELQSPLAYALKVGWLGKRGKKRRTVYFARKIHK
jgi:hypothetical protein